MPALTELAARARFARLTPDRDGARPVSLDKQRIHAAYDAAQTSEFNARYWKNADILSSDEANNPGVRQTLRMRARYECLEANSFARGIVQTLAHDTIGTGPRLQMRLGKQHKAANEQIERSFNAWAREIQLARKLRMMRISKCVDGETFAQLVTNRRLRHRVTLDLRPFEAEMCATPTLGLEPNSVDGIRFDEYGNPTEYHRLKSHPGGPAGLDPFGFEKLDPAEVIHLFRAERPGQHRGIPEVTTALPLFILLRDYTLAVLHNAKSVAKHTAYLETQASAVNETGEKFDAAIEPFDTVDIDYDMITSLPWGWKLNQLRAEQPSTTYKMFRDAILNEIARCCSMPFVIAAADSSGANYSSARLDIQLYDMAIAVERSEWELGCCDRLLSAWFDEAVLIPGLLPEGLGPLDELPHEWFWDSRGYSDPRHQAQAQEIRLRAGVSHRALEYGAAGLDVDAEDEKAAASLDLTREEYRRLLAQSTFNVPAAGQTADDEEEAPEDDDAPAPANTAARAAA